MKKLALTLFTLSVFAQLSFAQQSSASVNRVGDAFHGSIQQVKSESVQLRVKDGVTTVGPRLLIQVVNYSEDGRRRETDAYVRGLLRTKTVETYLPDGQVESISIYDGNGTLKSKTGYAYDSSGRPAVETNYQADGSIKEQKTNEWSDSGGLVGHTKFMKEGVETAVNFNNFSRRDRSSAPKRSVWTTNKPDGSRTENIFEVDASGTHNDQQINYGLDGTVTGRRVSIVDAGITRLEATEYEAAGNITKRTLQTREYDSHHNLSKIVEFRWNAERQKFEPFVITYHTIVYR